MSSRLSRPSTSITDESLMNREELVELASPPCHECGSPIQRVETRWHMNGDGDWVPGPTFMVCRSGHRMEVKPFGGEDE